MAYIYIKGFHEPFEINNERAKNISNDWKSGTLPEVIKFDELTIKAKEIKFIILDEEKKSINKDEDKKQESLKKYYKDRDYLLQLSPEIRAKKTAWKQFKILFYGLKGEFPNEEMKNEVENLAEKFFIENTEWSKPSLLIFKDFIGQIIPNNDLQIGDKQSKGEMRQAAIRILENDELSEIQDIKRNREYYKSYK